MVCKCSAEDLTVCSSFYRAGLTFGVPKRLGIPWRAERLLDFKEFLCLIGLVIGFLFIHFSVGHIATLSIKCFVDDEWVYCVGGMIPTDENRSTQRYTCPRANLLFTNTKRTVLASNPVLRGEWPESDGLRRDTSDFCGSRNLQFT